MSITQILGEKAILQGALMGILQNKVGLVMSILGYKQMVTTRKRANSLIFLALTLCVLLFVFPSSVTSQQTRNTVKEFSGLKIHQVEVPLTPPSKIETLYSWSLRDADVRDVMLTFAKGSKINIIVEPGVSGKVTVDLTKVKFEEVLEYILNPLGLEYSQEGDFLRIFKQKFKTRSFTVNYVNTQRSGSSSVSVGSASISNSNTVDFWGQLTNTLNAIIFADNSSASVVGSGSFTKEDSEGKRLIVNPQMGMILITASEEELQEAADFIQIAQTAAQRQVLIQAKIVEVNLSDGFEMGINWSNIAEYPKMSGILAGGAAISQGLLPVAQSGIFQLGITDGKTSFLLDAMATQGNLNVLSSPQIVTLNNQTAIIKIAREDVYFTITTTQDSQTDLITETIVSQTIDVGITLEVTPQISADGMVTLDIHPSITEVVDTAVSKKGDERPVIARRETNTVVRVKDGQTIIMAGLMKEKKTETLRMVPCLGEIPILGALFRHTVQGKDKIELVIMLTPLILTEDRIDIIHKYKTTELKKSQKKFKLGIVPSWEGTKGEF